MDRPSVSVVIAAYNAAAYLRDAVESVRRQTYPNYEVLLVDDGSQDATWEQIEGLQRGWPRVRGIRMSHGGAAAAKNRGIRAARGRWIALLDADDVWLETKLQRCVDRLLAVGDLHVVYSPMDVMTPDGEPMPGHSKKCYGGWIAPRLFQSTFVHDPAVVFDRRVVEICGGLNENIRVGSGYEFWLRVSTLFEFGLIKEPLAIRRWHEQSLTRSSRESGLCARAAILEAFYFQGGGRDLVPARQARRRLSKVCYDAGRAMAERGMHARAVEYLDRAVAYRRGSLRARLRRAICRAAARRESPAAAEGTPPATPGRR